MKERRFPVRVGRSEELIWPELARRLGFVGKQGQARVAAMVRFVVRERALLEGVDVRGLEAQARAAENESEESEDDGGEA